MMMGGIGGDAWKKIVREGVPRPYLPVEGRGKSSKEKKIKKWPYWVKHGQYPKVLQGYLPGPDLSFPLLLP